MSEDSTEATEDAMREWEAGKPRAEAVGMGLAHSYMQPCPAGCGRDRFDHEFMGGACDAYREFKARMAKAVHDGGY